MNILVDAKEPIQVAYTELDKLLRYFKVTMLTRAGWAGIGEDELLDSIADAITTPRVIILAIPEYFISSILEKRLLQKIKSKSKEKGKCLSTQHILRDIL